MKWPHVSLPGGIVICLTWIATMSLATCFFNTARDIPPAINTIVSVIVGGLVGVLTSRVPDKSKAKNPNTTPGE